MSFDPVSAGLGILDKLIGKVVRDKDLADKLRHEARSEEFQGDLSLLVGQLEINKIEAASSNMFVAGWRPGIGWICAAALAYNTILSPILAIWFTVPAVDTSLLYPVLMGLLGLGGLRTYEKSRGVTK